MGIEHENIHYETSSVLIRQIPIDLVKKPIGWSYGPMSSSKKIYNKYSIMFYDAFYYFF
jgi:hypothetical protein